MAVVVIREATIARRYFEIDCGKIQNRRFEMKTIVSFATVLLMSFCLSCLGSEPMPPSVFPDVQDILAQGKTKQALKELKSKFRDKSDSVAENAKIEYFRIMLDSGEEKDKFLETITKEIDKSAGNRIFGLRLKSVLALYYAREGNIQKAEEILSPFIRGDGGISALIASEKLGDIFLDSEKYARAADFYESAIAFYGALSSSEKEEVSRHAVSIRRISANFEKAKEKSLPVNAQNLFNKAMKLFAQEQFAEAHAIFQQIVSSYEEDELAEKSLYYSALTLYRQKKTDEAMRELKRYFPKHQKGSMIASAHLLAGDIYLEFKNDQDKALGHFEASEAISSKTTEKGVSPNEILADSNFRLAMIRHFRCEFDKAKEHYMREIAENPIKSADSDLPNHSFYLVEQCKQSASPVLFPELIAKGDKKSASLIFFADAYLESRRFEKAGYLFKLLLDKAQFPEISPEQEAYVNLEIGELFRMMQNNEDALRQFQFVQSQYPKSEYAPVALFREASILQGDRRKTEESRKILAGLLKKYPSSPYASNALNSLAFSEYCDGNMKEAEEKYKKILSSHRNGEFADLAKSMLELIKSEKTGKKLEDGIAIKEKVTCNVISPGRTSKSQIFEVQSDSMHIAILETRPQDMKLTADTGEIRASKRSDDLSVWTEVEDTDILHRAKSPVIKRGEVSWIVCTGEFVKTIVLPPGPVEIDPIIKIKGLWRSELAMPGVHIVVCNFYDSNRLSRINAWIRNAADAMAEQYSNCGKNPVIKGFCGVQRDRCGKIDPVPEIAKLADFLSKNNLQPASVSTFSSIGLGTRVNCSEPDNPPAGSSSQMPALCAQNGPFFYAMIYARPSSPLFDLLADPKFLPSSDVLLSFERLTSPLKPYMKKGAFVNLFHSYTGSDYASGETKTSLAKLVKGVLNEQVVIGIGGEIEFRGRRPPVPKHKGTYEILYGM